jgi:hypothetical protein
MEPPPPMMSAPMNRKRMLIVASIVFGLFLLFLGAVLIDASNLASQRGTPGGTDLATAWGPAVAHAGMFFFVVGLIAAAVFLEELDMFVRLFLLIVAFVAILLVLAGSPTIFR